MAKGGYVVLAWFRPQANRAREFADRMRGSAEKVRASEGVRQFEFHTAADAGDEFLLYEEFPSVAEWQVHHDTNDMVQLRAAIEPMIDARQRSVWTQVEGFVNQGAAPGHTTLVKFRMEPGSVEPMLDEMRKDVASAVGMLRFDLNAGGEDGNDFAICARWADRESWQAHQSRPDYIAFRERTAGYYATKPDRTLWRPLR